jgi:hypothetical protein
MRLFIYVRFVTRVHVYKTISALRTSKPSIRMSITTRPLGAGVPCDSRFFLGLVQLGERHSPTSGATHPADSTNLAVVEPTGELRFTPAEWAGL